MSTSAPGTAAAYFQDGMGFVRARDFPAAAEAFRRAAEADPQDSRAYNNLGATWAAMGRHREAIEAIRKAIALDPHYAQAHFNLGASLQALGDRVGAFRGFVRAIELDPEHDEAFYYLGMEHQDAGRLNEALACYLRSCELNPNAAHVFAAMGRALQELKRPREAEQAFEKALSLESDDSVVRALLLQLLAANCDWDRLAARQSTIPTLGVEGDPVPPFTMLALDGDPHRQRRRSENYAAASFSAIAPLPPVPRPAARPGRLRIGYFSSDFHDHPVFHCTARMFELHDRSGFEVHAYALGPARAGALRDRAAAAFDGFHEIGHLGDHEIAQLVRTHGIDIAIDLNGYTEHHRLGVFARRPAPVQMTYLGYPGTLGTSFIDYLIADRIVVPDRHRDAYAERLIYLPNAYQATDNSRAVPEPTISRSHVGLPDGFVFCCFNSSYKISSAAFDTWMEILKQIEGSVLWLSAASGTVERNLKGECAKRGVDPDRLVIAPRASHRDYLQRLTLADLFLDTFTYTAHGTASDALWAGVPLVTMTGEGFPSRVATTLLCAAGLSELATDNERNYAELALALARDPARLAAIRARLAASRTSAPLFDSEQFAKDMEQAFDLAFARFVSGQEPADIAV